jgi:hypothetical protein
MAEGVEDAGGSEGSAVMAETGPRERGYPARKGADFRRVSAERWDWTPQPTETLDGAS